jgi:hypothetical protein
MAATSPSTALIPLPPVFSTAERLALAGFLAGCSGLTRQAPARHHPGLGRRNRHSTAKARQLLEWQPRRASQTVLDCARSLIEHGAL